MTALTDGKLRWNSLPPGLFFSSVTWIRWLDEGLMHRLADGTVKELAESIAEQMEKAIRA